MGAEVRNKLLALGEEIRDDFVQNRRVMSFSEYLEHCSAQPEEQLRSAPQYIRDCFDYYGSEPIKYPYGEFTRYRLFDCPWADGRERLVGQEDVQNRIYRALTNFVNEGQSNKLLLLHGPNGSSKSTLVRCIGRAMQHYSSQAGGALYRFNWVFPTLKSTKGGIGFSGGGDAEHIRADTFAHLPDELIDAKLGDELRDHPMLLIPPERREPMMREMLGEHTDFILSDYLQYGRLSHRNKSIFEALLASYQGDYIKVLRHVQVERFFVEQRYREGYVTVEPQLSVDAAERQITLDRSVSALPAALQSLSLYEYGGELVNANRGLVEYSDLLKRPMEAFKYLIGTVERASVGLSNATLFLDLVYIGTSNEIHLAAFKEMAEFQSFKGRTQLVRVPYLLDYTLEQDIYADKLAEAARTRHVAPHCSFVAAMWATLSRMRKPMADKYGKEIAELIGRLSPIEKADLYAKGKVPESVGSSQGKELLANLRKLWRESESYPNYEGRTGASPRELQVALFNAANSSVYTYVSPMAILGEIEDLTKQTSVYTFLKQETLPGGFHDHRKFIALVKRRYIERVDADVKSSLGLVEETEYQRVFERYITHVMNWTKQEKVKNPQTGKFEDPDEGMMREVERTLDVTSKNEESRQDLIARIGAWSLDNPGERPVYGDIFADQFKRIKESYFDEEKKAVRAGIEGLMKYTTEDGRGLRDEEKARAEKAVNTMCERLGYNSDSARDAIGLLSRTRYSD